MADADRVQEYVFSPPDLRYVRGASRLRRDAIYELGLEAGVVYANGGVALAEFEDRGPAERFCKRAKELFRTKTVSATVTTAIAEYPEADFPGGWKRVRDQIESAKRQGNSVRSAGSHWLMKSCERCGEHPAQVAVAEHEHQRDVCAAGEGKETGRGEHPPR